MLEIVLAACMWLAPGPVQPDTVVVIGETARDLTGDGRLETISLVGRGRSIDSLAVRLVITAGSDTIYVDDLAPITRRVGFDGPVRTRTRPEQRRHLRDLEAFYFGGETFRHAADFIAMLEQAAPRHLDEVVPLIARQWSGHAAREMGSAEEVWAEIRRRNGIVFQYARGGDGLTAIAWSTGDQRFYRLWECC
jgi:hypothetical protein